MHVTSEEKNQLPLHAACLGNSIRRNPETPSPQSYLSPPTPKRILGSGSEQTPAADMVKHLLEKGARVNDTDYQGRSALALCRSLSLSLSLSRSRSLSVSLSLPVALNVCVCACASTLSCADTDTSTHTCMRPCAHARHEGASKNDGSLSDGLRAVVSVLEHYGAREIGLLKRLFVCVYV